MCRARRAEQSCVALEVEIQLRGIRDLAVNNSPGLAVPALICLRRVLREEAYVMTLSDNNDSDGRLDVLLRTCG